MQPAAAVLTVGTVDGAAVPKDCRLQAVLAEGRVVGGRFVGAAEGPCRPRPSAQTDLNWRA